jgi:hypothetical protein
MKQEAATQNIKNQLKSSTANEKEEEIKNKPMHGQFYQDLESPSAEEQKSLMWLCSSGLKEETKSLIIVAQDKALNTCYHQRNIKKQPTDSKRKIWYKAEHIKHIVTGCTTFAPYEYTNRQN